MVFYILLEGNAPSFPCVGLAAEALVETTERFPPLAMRRLGG
jgi:hypothetical protein